MFVDISQLTTSVNYGIRLMGDSKIDCENIMTSCKDRIIHIDRTLKDAGIGTRVSGRSLDRLGVPQLRPMVSALLSELEASRELFNQIDEQSLVNTFDALEHVTDKVLHPLIVQSDFSVSIDERFSKIDSLVQKVEPALQLFETVEQSCNELKSQISALSELKSALDSKPTTLPLPPPPVDWTKITFPPLPTPPTQPTAPQRPTIIRNEVKLSHDAQLRRCNVILRGPVASLENEHPNDPLSASKSFLENCKINNFHLFQKDLVSAFYLNKKDGRCTIRLVFSNQWTVDQILESAHMLKTGPELYHGVYLNRDRTEEEMREHRVLVSELRLKIREHPTTRWAIQNGTIVNKGHYSKPT